MNLQCKFVVLAVSCRLLSGSDGAIWLSLGLKFMFMLTLFNRSFLCKLRKEKFWDIKRNLKTRFIHSESDDKHARLC